MSNDLLSKRWQTFVVCSEDDPDDPFEPYMYPQWGGGMKEMAHDFFLLRPADLCPSGFESIPALSCPFPMDPLPAPLLSWPIL